MFWICSRVCSRWIVHHLERGTRGRVNVKDRERRSIVRKCLKEILLERRNLFQKMVWVCPSCTIFLMLMEWIFEFDSKLHKLGYVIFDSRLTNPKNNLIIIGIKIINIEQTIHGKDGKFAAASRRKEIEQKTFWKLKEFQIFAYNSY